MILVIKKRHNDVKVLLAFFVCLLLLATAQAATDRGPTVLTNIPEGKEANAEEPESEF
jgi:hypothetical protein